MDLICELGATTIRLAHYQHDAYFYDLCDEKGMVVWAEIPYISATHERWQGKYSLTDERTDPSELQPSIDCGLGIVK